MFNTSVTGKSDKELLLIGTLTCLILFVVLAILIPGSQAPSLITVFVGTNMISKTNFFANFANSAKPYFENLVSAFNLQNNTLPQSNNANYLNFLNYNQVSRLEILTAIKSLQSYSHNSKALNKRRRKLFNLMSNKQQRISEDVGYKKKLDKIDESIDRNQKFLSKISSFAVQNYGVSYLDFEYLRKQKSSQVSGTNYRVVESMSHFKRDWLDANDEIKPLLSYITTQLSKVDKDDTCVIVAGSGLGRIAHEVAKLGYAEVRAVEFSGLMHLCNQFVYSNEEDQEYFPHIHSNSNFINLKSQFRSNTLKPYKKPQNLHLDLHDFRTFKIDDKFSNAVIVSAFFIDTAENLIDYFDKINSLTTPTSKNKIKNGYWINVGPLKYGSAAQVELNADEIEILRKKMGWKDLDYNNDVNKDEILEYITDKESFWQGYYGVSKWTSERKENKNKIK